MTDNVPAYLSLSEEGMKTALIEARGDLFVASQLLGVTALRINRAVQISPTLQATLEVMKASDNRSTDAQIERAVQERVSLYRVTGLDALHDLAVMPISENSAQNQVKFAAGAKLIEGVSGGSSAGELEVIFRELRETYQKEAPRLRVIRQTTTTVEMAPGQSPSDRPVIDQDCAD